MKIRIEEIDQHVETVLAKVKAGILASRQNGDMLAELPERIDFQMEVITKENSITREQRSEQDGDSITETVELAHEIVRVTGEQVTTRRDTPSTSKNTSDQTTTIPKERTTESSEANTAQEQVANTNGGDKIETTYDYE